MIHYVGAYRDDFLFCWEALVLLLKFLFDKAAIKKNGTF